MNVVAYQVGPAPFFPQLALPHFASAQLVPVNSGTRLVGLALLRRNSVRDQMKGAGWAVHNFRKTAVNGEIYIM